MVTLQNLVCRCGVVAVALTVPAVAPCAPLYLLQPVNVSTAGTPSFVGIDDGNVLYGSIYNTVTKINKPFTKRYGTESILDAGANGEGVIQKVTGRIGFGYCENSATGERRAAYWQEGVLHLIAPFDRFQMTKAIGGSPFTAIYGTAKSDEGYADAMWRYGSISPLQYPYHRYPLGSGLTAANGVGMGVGYQAYIPASRSNPLSWKYGALTVLPAWDGVAQAVDVNEKDEILCTSTDIGGYHYTRVCFNGGDERLAGLNTGNGALGRAINDHGTVVGKVDGITGNGNGMSVWYKEDGYANHRLLDLLINPGLNITGLVDINNRGVILGTYKVGTVTKYFLAKPLSQLGH